MSDYAPNGKSYVPGLYVDPLDRFRVSYSTASGQPFVIVANPNSTSANVEAFTLTTGGVASIGGTSTGVNITAGVVFSSGIQVSTGTTATAIKGLHTITLSTITPAAAGGTSTQTYQRFDSTAFTWSTNDLILGVTLPSSYGSTAATSAIFGGAFPTSSGAIAMAFFAPVETGSGTSTAISVSTGAYKVVTLRTT